jgi:hypothetical protein
MAYTLVQHTGYTVGGNPQFKAAVEERAVQTKRQERAIRRAGGVIRTSYSAARDLATATNYPPGAVGLIPHAKGKFVTRKGFDEPIFVPHEETQLEDS